MDIFDLLSLLRSFRRRTCYSMRGRRKGSPGEPGPPGRGAARSVAHSDFARRPGDHLKEEVLAFETILYEEDGPIGTLTLNRPDDSNMFTHVMCHEIRDCIEQVRRETRTRVLVITGAGERFFCIGGRKSGMEDTILYAGTLPTLEMYEAIDKLHKPVIASVNGFAVGGGNVLQMVCDLTIAKESAVFRQVGPMMGSFDADYVEK